MGRSKFRQVAQVTVVSVAALLIVSGTELRQSVVLPGVVLAAQRGGQGSGSGGTNQPITPPNTGSPTALPPLDSPNVPDGGMRARMEGERVKALNDDRHKRLAADVDRLVELTNELKTDVDKTTKDELSVDVIKKAQEIEKLAHDVQSRMKN